MWHCILSAKSPDTLCVRHFTFVRHFTLHFIYTSKRDNEKCHPVKLLPCLITKCDTYLYGNHSFVFHVAEFHSLYCGAEVSCYPGYFWERHWLSRGLPEISRATLTSMMMQYYAHKQWSKEHNRAWNTRNWNISRTLIKRRAISLELDINEINLVTRILTYIKHWRNQQRYENMESQTLNTCKQQQIFYHKSSADTSHAFALDKYKIMHITGVQNACFVFIPYITLYPNLRKRQAAWESHAWSQSFLVWMHHGCTNWKAQDFCDPFYYHVLTVIPAWISNCIHYKVWDEITYPFSNFNGATVEVWEWISNSIRHLTGHIITYSCAD